MGDSKFFYSIVRYNGRLASRYEFYPLMDQVQYGDEDHAKKLVDFVNKTVQVSGGDPVYRLFKIDFEEI